MTTPEPPPQLRAQARARRVPTREELAKLLLGRSHGDVPWEAFGERIRQRYLEDADAVLRLFAEAVTSDNEPPVPLPEVLPAGTRTHECGGFAFETEATLTMEWCNRPHYRTMHPTGQVGLFEASEVDWAHYRAQRRAAEPTPGTVLGTARVVFRGKAEPREVEAPEPGGFLDAVNAKLAHLEGKTQGMAEGTAGEFRRVDATLRAHSGAIDAIAKRVERIERAMDSELAAYDMRIEREERERDGR